MIRHTFSMLNGIGEKLERRLWRSGILTWEDFVGSSGPDFLSSDRKAQYDGHLSAALAALERGNSRYFNETLRRREHWRLFERFREDALYLDIETNGLMPGDGGYVTVVGLYDGRDYRALVRGENLSEEALLGELSGYKYLVTFFGAVFDIPFLQRSMGLMVNIPHFDLCFGAKRMGLKGGLKRIEGSLGIEREEAVRGMDGYDAVLLWERARRGSSEAIELLVAYNREDTVNLREVAEEVYGGLKALTGIERFVNGGGSGEGA